MAQQVNFLSAQVLRSNLQQFYEKPVTRVSLELFLSLSTVIFFALFALRPTLNTMSRLVREIEEKRQVDDELSKKIAALSTAQNEFLTFRSRLSVLDTAVHQELSIENALIYLEYLSAEAGVSLSGLQIREFPLALPAASGERARTAEREIGIHTAQISFEGNIESVKRLFQMIESVRPLLAVQGFSVTVREERGQQPVVTANATLLFYGYQPKVAPARTAAPRAAAAETGAEE